LTIILAIKAENGIVLSADRRVVYTVGDVKFSSENEKIVQIGKNTIMGFSGDLKNSGQLVMLLRNNSGALDNDMFSALNALKEEIRKIDLDCECLLAGKVNNDLAVVRLTADKRNRVLAIEITVQRVETAGDIISMFSYLNLTIQQYINYLGTMRKSLTVDEAEFLAYITIMDISKSGSETIGNGVSIWRLVKDGKNINMEKTSEWKLNDIFPTAYAYYDKKKIGAIVDAMNLIKKLYGKDIGQLLRKEEKDKVY
jgi:ATP-dependent protease HslVU (ClpYQ) peptidase subunit